MTLRSHPRVYDAIGGGYAQRRVADPRIAARILAALGGARRVCNVGAGAGSYEPADREVVAVEPSLAMIAQRRGGAPVVRAVAEALPFPDDAFDAALASLTVHHWRDPRAGLAEMRRVARRAVVFAFDVAATPGFWLVRDYVPAVLELDSERTLAIDELARALGGARVEPVPIPWDCTDGFQAAYWRRPERYLDPDVRASISSLAQLPPEAIRPGIARLEADLASGAWAERNADLLARDEHDFGYRLLLTEGS